jgi:hypothetical protein
MTEGVKDQASANLDNTVNSRTASSDKELNFRRLEAQRDEARERAARMEQEAASMKQRLEALEERTRPKEIDPLEGAEDYDPARIKAHLEQRDRRLKKEAEDITERKFQEYKKKEEKQNHEQRLKSTFKDYDEVMTEDNVVHFEQTNPEFIASLLHITDDFERKKLAYGHFKRNLPSKEERPSIKARVEENKENPYYIAPGSGTPAAVDFDIKSPKARQDAYAKLKAAQRKPIGGRSG